MALLSLIASVLFASMAVQVSSDPHAFPSFDLPLFQMKEEKCPYTVIVTTSCQSPESTRDHISLTFGDDDGNQVYAPRLDQGETFDKCSSKTFQMKGQCLNQICYVYIYRTGPDGWVPQTVEVYAEGSKAVQFNFNKTGVPENTWYGSNQCNNTGPETPPYFPPETPTPFPPHTPSPPPLYPPERPSLPPPPYRPSAASTLLAAEHAVLAVAVAVAVAVAAAVV